MTLPLTNQVVTKETAQRMAALGFPQESLYCWKPDGGWHLSQKPGKLSVAAYTLSEVIEFCGEHITYLWKSYREGKLGWEAGIGMAKNDHTMVVWDEEPKNIWDENPLEAAASFACYLKENKLI